MPDAQEMRSANRESFAFTAFVKSISFFGKKATNQAIFPVYTGARGKKLPQKKETKPTGQKERIMKMNNTMTLNLNEMEMVNGGWDLWGSH